MEELSFFTLLNKSWHLSHARFRFFLFGGCIALPLASQSLLPLANVTKEEEVIALVSAYPGYTLAFLLLHFSCIWLGKSQLIPALYSELRSENSQHTTSPSLSPSSPLKKTAILDIILGLFLFLVIIVLLLPSLLSFLMYQNIPETLITLGLLVFLPLFFLTFLIREFSLFYFLLSPLRLFPSLERGVSLFLGKRFLSLSFGLFCFFLSILFTFSLNLVMLGGVVLWQRFLLSEAVPFLPFVVSFIGLTWYIVFSQALWLTFFVTLASPSQGTTPKETPSTEEKISEIPAV